MGTEDEFKGIMVSVFKGLFWQSFKRSVCMWGVFFYIVQLQTIANLGHYWRKAFPNRQIKLVRCRSKWLKWKCVTASQNVKIFFGKISQYKTLHRVNTLLFFTKSVCLLACTGYCSQGHRTSQFKDKMCVCVCVCPWIFYYCHRLNTNIVV